MRPSPRGPVLARDSVRARTVVSVGFLTSSTERRGMPKISVEIPQELLDDLDEHVGDDGKFVNRSDAIRSCIRKTLDILDDIDARHGRLEEDE